MGKDIYGLMGPLIAHYGYKLQKETKRPILFITSNEIESVNLFKDVSAFMPCDRFQPFSFQFLQSKIKSGTYNRIETLIKGIQGSSIVTSVDALLPFLAPKNEFLRGIITLKTNKSYDLASLAKKLNSIGYERVDLVEAKGQYAIRGDIVDIGSIENYRIEFFDDEIYSIKSLDIESQRSTGKEEEINIYPLITTPCKDYSQLLMHFTKEYETVQKSIDPAVQRMSGRLDGYISALKKGLAINDIECFGKYMYEAPGFIADYMDNPIIIMVNPKKVEDRQTTFMQNFTFKFAAAFEKGNALSFHENMYNTDVINTLDCENIHEEDDYKGIKHSRGIYLKPADGEKFFDFIKDTKDYKTYIFCASENRALRFIEMLRERDIKGYYSDEFCDIEKGTIMCLPKFLNSSAQDDNESIRLISDWSKPKLRTKKKGSNIDVFTDLSVGDFVVHENHGIGKYVGIKTVKSQGKVRDYIGIEYQNSSMLYLPTEQMDRIQKYVGSKDSSPRLSKLGGDGWNKTKSKVKQSALLMAEDLIKLYASRSSKMGFAFSQDNAFQKEFEDSFEYEDTVDQEKSINEIKADMESNVIMDRLLCGDVGYGKTEMAVRAMFKCVMDSKQAAFLVPTVVLSRQHYNTVKYRLENYPINIALLSRYTSTKEEKEILKKLELGEIDIIIGTHKLLNKKVVYKDLGLLVVDEEQRFGVGDKEKIKSLKNDVDVLTLSATPIPRTLYMSLIGVRDISVINTPPQNRQVVETFVVEYDESMVTDAIVEEIARGGKVYYLYNDVESIDSFAQKIQDTIPMANVAVGHGQMPKNHLEQVMLDFYAGDVNVLVCSTIIESGLDVSDANTIIVYDADRLGLSQLYQLRGRVGRGEKQAFAYFTYKGSLSDKAYKRLSAIRDFTDFGSGFKIAMRDLEIRGAGSLLGSKQSGNLTMVGYDMYCRLIEEAVNEVKGISPGQQEVETQLKIDIDAHIPDYYISSNKIKIEVYKQIAHLESEANRGELEKDIEDKFGKLPGGVKGLIDVAVLKLNCQSIGITQIQTKNYGFYLSLSKNNKVNPAKIMSLAKKYGLSLEDEYHIKLKNMENDVLKLNKFVKSLV